MKTNTLSIEEVGWLFDNKQIKVTAIEPHHLRITHNNIEVDIFPRSKKFEYPNEDLSGTYTNLVLFLKLIFKLN
jgi:hypothetical protein